MGVEENTANSAVDWQDLLSDARPCGRCGKQASIPASVSDDGVHEEEGAAIAVANAGPEWFCFECGHQERRAT
jgi:hypothetical protein